MSSRAAGSDREYKKCHEPQLSRDRARSRKVRPPPGSNAGWASLRRDLDCETASALRGSVTVLRDCDARGDRHRAAQLRDYAPSAMRTRGRGGRAEG